MNKIKMEKILLANVASSQLAQQYRLELARTMRKLSQQEGNGND